MNATEWKWHTNDGLEIYSKAWTPTSQPRAVVCLVHGVGEHIDRYQWDAEALTEAGYILAGFDQRGFGRSGGRRGHTPSLETYFDDIDCFLTEVAQRYPGEPRFLYGHSMGAMLVLSYTPVRQPMVKGVIATGPGFDSGLQKQKLKVFLVKLLGKVWPTLTLKSGIDPKAVSRDPKVVEAYMNDPLVHFWVSAAWGLAMMKTIELSIENAPRFPRPLLLMHGTKDALNYPSSSRRFAALAPKELVTLRMWEGFLHELHTDPEKAEVFQVMTDWLNAH